MEKTLSIAVGLLLGATACSASSGEVDITDSGPTGSAGGGHPLVPAEYQYYWNTDSCALEDGSTGIQTYWLGEGSIDSEGNLEVTERRFWFFGNPDYEGDCVDTFELTGMPDTSGIEASSLGCASCDGVWTVQRTLVTDNCSRDYAGLLSIGDGSANSVDGYVLVDLVDAEGLVNAGNAVLVVYAEPRESEGYDIDAGYATGNSDLDADEATAEAPPWPATLEWLGSDCLSGP